MKRLLFLLFLMPNLSFSKTITLDIPDRDLEIVADRVEDPIQWLKDAWAGQVNRAREEMIQKEYARSRESQEAVPAGDNAIVEKVLRAPNYRNRKQRDADDERRRRAAEAQPSPTRNSR